MMTGLFIVLIFLFFIFSVLLGLIRPILQWIYYIAVDFFIEIGISERGAKAIVSIIILIIIFRWLL